MDETIRWGGVYKPVGPERQISNGAVVPRYGGDGSDEPVLVATISGLIEVEMARDTLQAAGIPAYFRRNSLGPVYGLSVGSFGKAEVWAPPPLADRTRDLLVGIGLLDPGED